MNIPKTKQMLMDFYGIYTDDIPALAEKIEWKAANKFGFFLGILSYGQEAHVATMHQLLLDKIFKDHQEFSNNIQRATPGYSPTFIDLMFDHYIAAFNKNYRSAQSCHTPAGSPVPSVGDLPSLPDENVITHVKFKQYVAKRDGVCLFCWQKLECEGAHIIAQKNDNPVAYDESSILTRAGLRQKHQVQNGLLLCTFFHGRFDKLKRFVDVVDGKLVVKVVNASTVASSHKHQDWLDETEEIKE
jgi:HNH endonuclease